MMSVASSITSTNLSNLCSTYSPCRSSRSASVSSLLRPISTSRRRYLTLVMHSINSSSYGDEDPNMKAISSQPPKEPPTQSPSLPKTPTWLKWTLGSIVWLSLPSWKKLQSIQDVVTKVDSTVEVIERVAETTEKIVSNVAEDLPDGMSMKKAVLKLEKASEEVLEDVQAIDAFVDKVEELVEEWKEKLKDGEEMDQGKVVEKKEGTV